MKDLVLSKEKIDLEKLYKIVEKSYNTLVVLDKFCSFYQEIEKIANIIPIIKFLHRELDIAYSLLIESIEDN